MLRKIVIVTNLVCDDISVTDGENLNQRIIFYASIFVESLLNLFPLSQIALLSIKDGSLEQLAHFSGNKFHHNQGFFRLQKKNNVGRSEIKDALILAKKLLGKENCDVRREIILLTSENPNISFHAIVGILMKEKIIISTVLFSQKIFIFETLAKITKGFCFYVDTNVSKNLELFKTLNCYRSTNMNVSYSLETATFHFRFFFCPLYLKGRNEIKNTLKSYCKKCGFITQKRLKLLCPKCLILEDKFYKKFQLKERKIHKQIAFSDSTSTFSHFSAVHTLAKISNLLNRLSDFYKDYSLATTFQFFFISVWMTNLSFIQINNMNLKSRIFSTGTYF